MAADIPPKRSTAYTCYVNVVSQANLNVYQTNPTIVAGDFQVSVDSGSFNNLATLPTVSPAGGKQICVALSSTEMGGDVITVIGSDQAGAEWADAFIHITTGPVQIGEVADAVYVKLMSISPFRMALASDDFGLYRGDTWVQPITRLADMTGYTQMWVTARENRGDTDAQSAFQVLLSDPPVATDGLQYINGARAGTPGNAAITITSLVGGSISVRIEAAEAAKLEAMGKLKWDYQWTDGTDTQTRRRGDLFVTSDVTRVTG